MPVPSRPSGFRLGSGDVPVQIEVFVDLECPFSKKAWPTVLAVANHYESESVAITAHSIVLCDHRQSWDLTKAVVAIAAYDPLRAWQFIGHLYQHQADYGPDAFDHKTRQDLRQLIEDLAAKFDPALSNSDLAQQISDEEGAVASRAKASVRYAISRGVWSTPTVFINGSPVPELESSSTLSDWQTVIAPTL
ncbi:thioredoxin domain-containing protein [Leptolyngbya sp. CCNP1308]|uniref:DsbA family protein n=1 Tax=Leptolyngbya sp. CCNP1308 TaxID=3110255 RepID=UPI002B1FD55F|nr:thioredoxin domain-containing protein [Leptolyngbya sp. CCNP1308]MEA5449098.1 thioredoxin domain-containing protein [Leptolyngbya sp. CCNP1308]